MTKVYVSDTNIWIDFKNAGLLELLFELPITYCCTEFVKSELRDFNTQDLIERGLRVEVIDGSEMPQLFALMQEHGNSSLADVSCFLLAKNARLPLLTGDGRLRKAAVAAEVEVFGSLWLLDYLVETKTISSQRAAMSLRDMLDRGARLPRHACDERFRNWG